MSRKERENSKRKGFISTQIARIPIWVRFVLIAFLSMLLLLFLQSWILSLNREVRELQNELDDVNATIDSLEGQLISSTNKAEIEAQARALGMTEAQPGQYIYEAAAKKKTVINNSPVGLYDYINFFTQVRKEKLWPQSFLGGVQNR